MRKETSGRVRLGSLPKRLALMLRPETEQVPPSPPYSIHELVHDLAVRYGSTATTQAIALSIAARDRGLKEQQNVFTQAAIMLCHDMKFARKAGLPGPDLPGLS